MVWFFDTTFTERSAEYSVNNLLAVSVFTELEAGHQSHGIGHVYSGVKSPGLRPWLLPWILEGEGATG